MFRNLLSNRTGETNNALTRLFCHKANEVRQLFSSPSLHVGLFASRGIRCSPRLVCDWYVACPTFEVRRLLSTTTKSSHQESSYHGPQIVARTESGNPIVAFDARKHAKLKPSIVRRRLARMRTYVGTEKKIRHSPWRLNLICQFVAGLPLQDALTQLEFLNKIKAPLVQKVLRRTANLADIRDGLQPSQLEVAECFATKGEHLKRIMRMGKGRFGRMEHQHAHMRVVLREIDFKLKIYQAPNLNQKKKWFLMQQQAERDSTGSQAKREELERLERLEKQAAASAAAADIKNS